MNHKNLHRNWAASSILIVLLLCAVGITKSYAYDFSAVCETGQTLYYNITNSESYFVEITGGTNLTGNLILPSEVYNPNDNDYYYVTSIGSNAFNGCSGLTSLTISNTISVIRNQAFDHCSGLAGSLIIPNSITTIESDAFRFCSGLTSVYIPNSVESISFNVFGYCSNLEQIEVESGNPKYDSRDNCCAIIDSQINRLLTGCKNTIIPNSVYSIGSGAFIGCSGLTSIVIPNSISDIWHQAFADCTGLTSISLPGVSKLWTDVFSGCSNLTSVTFSNSLVSIGSNAFGGCTNLSSIVLPNSLASIGYNAFQNCTSLTSITIPSSVTNIYYNYMESYGLFNGCTSLEQIVVESGNTVYDSRNNCNAIIESGTNTLIAGCMNTIIPNSVTAIGNGAFHGCTGLTSITIPISVNSISSYGFRGCTALSSIIVQATTPPTLGNSVFSGIPSSIPVVVPCGLSSAYHAASGWSIFTNYQEDCSFITFDDANVKAICVTNWDTDGDGELSYTEAAAVTDLGQVFRANTSITSFNELQYFTGLTEIGDYAFYNCSNLTSIIIPNSVTSIGGSAFYSSGLTSITIPNSVISIGQRAFSSCSELTTVNWNAINVSNYPLPPNNNPFSNIILTTVVFGNQVQTIPVRAFSGFSGLTGSLTLPNSVTSIGDYAFNGCSGFTGNLVIPSSVTTIGEKAFFGCSGFTGSLTIPNSVTSIGISAFEDCSGFTGSLTLSNSVTILDETFRNCSGFTGTLIIPNSVTDIWNGAFENCSGFTGNLIIGNSVTRIGGNAFKGCSGFTGDLTIPNSVIYLSGRSFENCSGFDGSLTLGNSLIEVGQYVFKDCSGFTGDLIIPNSVTEIGIYAFCGCSGFTGNLTIGNSVTSIGRYAFENCSGFTGNLTLPNSITEIGMRSFYNCSGLTGNLTLPNSLTTIGGLAFSGCCGFTGDLIIPNSVTSIGNEAFCCSGFTGNLIIPSSVTTIGERAFNGCSNFETIIVEPNNMFYDSRDNCNALINTNTNELVLGCKNTVIPNSIITICEWAFYGCSELTSITIPNSVTTIGSGAFSNCSELTTVNWEAINVINYPNDSYYHPFNNCINLTTVVFGNQVQTIPNRAFYGFSGLTGSLTIPNSVTSIGKYAFYGCIGFTGNLTIPSSVNSIGQRAFSGCSGLSGSLTIPNSVTNIGNHAFYGCSGISYVAMISITPPTLGASVFSATSITLRIYVPYESLGEYKTAAQWSNYESRIYPWLQKSIAGYGESNDNWVFIASPLVEDADATTVDNMIAETQTDFDLYRFNQSVELEWENYKKPGEHYHFVLENGRGYLYANAEDVSLMFKGNFNENETEEVGLIYDAGNPFAGWNLVGNPFPVQAYANRSYYVMNEDGTGIEPVAVSSEVAIEPCMGVMVKAEASETNPKVTFSKTAPDGQGNQGVLQIAVAQANTRSNTVLDKAIVSFNEDDALGKFVFNEDNAKIWIPCGNEDFAIVCAEKTSETPLNFEAKEDGTYTISVEPENVEMDYLHLIDNLTGADVDLLQTPEYTFDAKKSDYASRFKLVFATNEENGPSTGSRPFAFYNGNEWVVSNTGEATLQIVDMMGRVLSSEPINGNATISLNQTPGVYMLRLVSGDSVQVQKVVVR